MARHDTRKLKYHKMRFLNMLMGRAKYCSKIELKAKNQLELMTHYHMKLEIYGTIK